MGRQTYLEIVILNYTYRFDEYMNLNQLRFVKAVSETRSFSQAAERCCVTQPTLSNGIAQFEKELGARIFERTTRKVALTRFGEHVLPMVESVLDARAELVQGAAAYLNPQQKLARIGLSPLIDARLLASVLEPFRRAHADVEIFFKECHLNDLIQRLEEEKIDLVIRPRLIGQPRIINHAHCMVYDEDLYYFAKSNNSRSDDNNGPVLLDSIAADSYVMTGDFCGLAAATRELFDAHGLKLLRYGGHAQSYQVLQEWSDLGIGAAILPDRKISAEHRSRARQVILNSGEPAKVVYDAIWNRNAAHSPHVTDLHDHFQNKVPQLVQGLAA